MKVAHWGLNALLLTAGAFCVYLGITHATLADGSAAGMLNRVMTGVTGIALMGIGGAMSWFTWKRG